MVGAELEMRPVKTRDLWGSGAAGQRPEAGNRANWEVGQAPPGLTCQNSA